MAAIIDIGVLLILLISAGVAFFRGFIREVLTIVGVIGAALASLMFGKLLAPHMREWFGVVEGQPAEKLFDLIPYSIVADVSAYASIFLVVFIILQLASHFISASAKAVGLGPVDRALGVAFGLVRGLILLAILYLPFSAILTQKQKDSWLEGSVTFMYIEATSEWLASFLPDGDKQKTISDTREKLKAMDVLDSGKNEDDATSDAKDDKPAGGYSDQDREKLEGLIENQVPDTERRMND
jgi:membrane protein required for colicin V production